MTKAAATAGKRPPRASAKTIRANGLPSRAAPSLRQATAPVGAGSNVALVAGPRAAAVTWTSPIRRSARVFCAHVAALPARVAGTRNAAAPGAGRVLASYAQLPELASWPRPELPGGPADRTAPDGRRRGRDVPCFSGLISGWPSATRPPFAIPSRMAKTAGRLAGTLSHVAGPSRSRGRWRPRNAACRTATTCSLPARRRGWRLMLARCRSALKLAQVPSLPGGGGSASRRSVAGRRPLRVGWVDAAAWCWNGSAANARR